MAQRVGLCHCPSCDLFACRSCWAEAADSCPECGISFAAASAAETHSEALAAGALAANAIRGEEEPPARADEPEVWADEETGWAEVPGAWAGVPTEPPATIAGLPPEVPRRTTRAVPIGIGITVVVAALFALILGNPFGAGGVESALNPTSSPSGSTRVGGPVGAGAPSARAEGSPTVDTPTDPTATGPIARPPDGPASTPRPTPADATPRPGATATPGPTVPGATPTPKPPATAAPTTTPSPSPTPSPAPTPTPTPEPPPACHTVPDLVGLTVGNARSAWAAAGFTGAFSPANGQTNRIVATQNRTPGACLPPGTSVSVTSA